MKAILFHANEHHYETIDLPAEKELLSLRVKEILGCADYSALGSAADLIHVCVDSDKVDPRNQARAIEGITAPVYDTVVLVGFDQESRQYTDIAESFAIALTDLAVRNISPDQARERLGICCAAGMSGFKVVAGN